jgi:hypothetical protein
MKSEYAVAQCLLELAIQNRALLRARTYGPLPPSAVSSELAKAREEYAVLQKDIDRAIERGDVAAFSGIFDRLAEEAKRNSEADPTQPKSTGLSR